MNKTQNIEKINKAIEDKLSILIKSLMKKAFFRKFADEKKIYIPGMYEYLKKQLGFTWLKKKSFYSKARKIYERLYQRYRNAKKQKKLQKLQDKYKGLKIIEAYAYLNMQDKFKYINDDFETFEEFLEILFAKIKKKKERERVD